MGHKKWQLNVSLHKTHNVQTNQSIKMALQQITARRPAAEEELNRFDRGVGAEQHLSPPPRPHGKSFRSLKTNSGCVPVWTDKTQPF